ncbi:hypothetical protein VQ056_21280 [Paenibacillus sp. JTLBN-2024]
MASSLTSVSINVGIAMGSALGGFVMTNMKLIDLSWSGGIVAVLAAVLAFINDRLERGDRRASAFKEETELSGQYGESM